MDCLSSYLVYIWCTRSGYVLVVGIVFSFFSTDNVVAFEASTSPTEYLVGMRDVLWGVWN